MIRFAPLLSRLEADTAPAARAAMLAAWLPSVREPDRVAAFGHRSGQRPRRPEASPTELRLRSVQATGLPDWLVAESLALTRDSPETDSVSRLSQDHPT